MKTMQEAEDAYQLGLLTNKSSRKTCYLSINELRKA